VRASAIRVFIVPHHRWRPGGHDHWQHLNPSQRGSADLQLFAAGSWGGEFHPQFGPRPGDVVVQEHWAQNGFANTDLDMQLKQAGIRRVIVVGMVANTCVESTARYGMEIGYHVTLVKDATAAFGPAGMETAHVVNGPTYAHALLTTGELLQQLPAVGPAA
jgi:nicotinamidase-related amidase